MDGAFEPIGVSMSRSPMNELVSWCFASLIESSDDAIVSKDLNGIVTSWNPGAERIFGYLANEMIGREIRILIPPDRQDEEPAILARIAKGERVDHYETIRQRKDGTLIDVSLTISPIRNPSGQIIGASKIARDITERVRINEERNRLLESERAARTESERASRLRDEFLAVVSHELRTPLNGILGWAQIANRADNLPPAVSDALHAIENNARTQAQLIDDLLDMNRIMAGKMHLDVQTVHLGPIIESALETLKPAVEAKFIRVQTTLATNAGPIKGDRTRLQQIVWNLVSNAVKFTRKGGKVQVLLQRIDSHVEICVADDGVGIKPEFLPHVFDRFRQADSSTSRQHGGLGLGLSIVKQLVELHGGAISAESDGAGKGATFLVRLPISIVKRQSAGEPEFQSRFKDDPTSLAGIRILAVDDDAGASEVMRRMLIGYGAEARTVNSAAEALPIISEAWPDIVLSDIGMPGMDGYELLRKIRADKNTVPAVAITAFARAEDRIRSLQAGYSMHVSKPLDAQELLTVIQAVLRSTGRFPT